VRVVVTEGSARGKVERLEPSKPQRAAARRVAESKATIPHLYMETEAAMGDALAFAGRGSASGDDKAPGPLEIVVRAVALALREVPRLNGAYRDGAAEVYSRVNIGVAIPGPDGPLAPTLFDADRKSLEEIATELRGLEARAPDGSLTAAELAGGTFTVAWPLGEIRSFAPIIAGGQAGNLGIGGGAKRVVATLSADARMIDPPTAAEFLDRFRAALVIPDRLA